MIEKLHAEIAAQLTPPEYIYTADVSDGRVRFSIDKSMDFGGVSYTDPIAKAIISNCIKLQIDHDSASCSIAPYDSRDRQVVMDIIGRYFTIFLKNNMKQKNPTVTKLYKWVYHYLYGDNLTTRADDDFVMLYRYLADNVASHKDCDVHIKNGIGILEKLKAKYEAKGYKLGEGYNGRRRRY